MSCAGIRVPRSLANCATVLGDTADKNVSPINISLSLFTFSFLCLKIGSPFAGDNQSLDLLFPGSATLVFGEENDAVGGIPAGVRCLIN